MIEPLSRGNETLSRICLSAFSKKSLHLEDLVSKDKVPLNTSPFLFDRFQQCLFLGQRSIPQLLQLLDRHLVQRFGRLGNRLRTCFSCPSKRT
jgi:hypothetical protein